MKYIVALALTLAFGLITSDAQSEQSQPPPAKTALVWAAPGSVTCTPPKGGKPEITQAFVIDQHYAIARANVFPAAGDFSRDERVCLYDGQKGVVGRLVFVEYVGGFHDSIPVVVLIRFEEPLNVSLSRLAAHTDELNQFVRGYFAGWGKHVPDQPKF